MLQTIGYEGTTIDAVITALTAAGTKLLIDVRAVPQSRKPGFSKRQLAAALDQAGISYVHLQPLGTPKPGRDAVRAGHPEHMIRIFTEHMRADAPQAALSQAIGLTRQQPSCLLCFERNPHHCHRRLVAEMITHVTGDELLHLAA